MPTREILDVVHDLYTNTVCMWQPIVAALSFKLSTSLLTLWRHCPVSRAVDWLATWTLIAVILLIVQTAVRF